MFTWLRQFIICWQMISMRPMIFSFFLSFFILLCSSEYLIEPNHNNLFPYTSSTRFFFSKVDNVKKSVNVLFYSFQKAVISTLYKTTALNYMYKYIDTCIYIYIYLILHNASKDSSTMSYWEPSHNTHITYDLVVFLYKNL